MGTIIEATATATALESGPGAANEPRSDGAGEGSGANGSDSDQDGHDPTAHSTFAEVRERYGRPADIGPALGA